MLMIVLLSLLNHAQAATAKVEFVADTNVPGVSVEGNASGLEVNFDSKIPAGAIVELDVFQLQTGMEKRDKHLREKVFAAQKIGDAKIKFEVISLTAPAGGGKGVLKGKLQIKDVSKEVEIPVDVAAGGKSLNGKTEVALKDFSLPRPSFMGVKVEETVKVSFTLAE